MLDFSQIIRDRDRKTVTVCEEIWDKIAATTDGAKILREYELQLAHKHIEFLSTIVSFFDFLKPDNVAARSMVADVILISKTKRVSRSFSFNMANYCVYVDSHRIRIYLNSNEHQDQPLITAEIKNNSYYNTWIVKLPNDNLKIYGTGVVELENAEVDFRVIPIHEVLKPEGPEWWADRWG